MVDPVIEHPDLGDGTGNREILFGLAALQQGFVEFGLKLLFAGNVADCAEHRDGSAVLAQHRLAQHAEADRVALAGMGAHFGLIGGLGLDAGLEHAGHHRPVDFIDEIAAFEHAGRCLGLVPFPDVVTPVRPHHLVFDQIIAPGAQPSDFLAGRNQPQIAVILLLDFPQTGQIVLDREIGNDRIVIIAHRRNLEFAPVGRAILGIIEDGLQHVLARAQLLNDARSHFAIGIRALKDLGRLAHQLLQAVTRGPQHGIIGIDDARAAPTRQIRIGNHDRDRQLIKRMGGQTAEGRGQFVHARLPPPRAQDNRVFAAVLRPPVICDILILPPPGSATSGWRPRARP